ncbi:MAG: acetoacetate--CoA ligase, partial [Nocardioides sp.]
MTDELQNTADISDAPHVMQWGQDGSRLDEFAAWAGPRHGRRLGDYSELHAWSTDHPEEFWGDVWEYFDVVTSHPYEQVLTGGPMPDHTWFPGARLNFVDQVFRHRDLPGAAVVSIDEAGSRSELTWRELEEQALAFAGALRGPGVTKGDRVVGYLTNGPEAIVAFLGAAALGAIWAGCGPDYGVSTAADRMSQLEPSVLVAATGYDWNGRGHDRREAVAELAASLSVRAVVEVPRGDRRLDANALDGIQAISWTDALASRPIDHVEQVEADHPLWVLFSSGTTGVPKGIVHGHAGVVAVQLAMLGLAHDLGPGDTMFWYTTPNWMMWNIVVSVLLAGVRTVTYEGSPVHPDPARLWGIAADEGVTMFGTSPGHLQATRGAGVVPKEDPGTECLRVIAATGAPVPVALNAWVREAVGPDVPVLSVCGGTDVVSAFLGCSPWLPVWDGEISGPSLGVAAHAFDAAGRAVRNEVGELVVTSPGPSMPLFFWNDPDKKRYRETYFETYRGSWRQGDWVTQTSRGSFVVHGRSDSTLNRNGVRLGSSELYEIVESDAAVAEALVLGVERPDGSYR